MRHDDAKHDNIPADRQERLPEEMTPLETLKRAWMNASDDDLSAFLEWLDSAE